MRAGSGSVFKNCQFCGKLMISPAWHIRRHARRLHERVLRKVSG